MAEDATATAEDGAATTEGGTATTEDATATTEDGTATPKAWAGETSGGPQAPAGLPPEGFFRRELPEAVRWESAQETPRVEALRSVDAS
jgi:hypothetical protein